MPAAPGPRWLSLFVGGERVLAHPVAAAAAAAPVEAGCVLDHRLHEDMIEVWLEDAAGRRPDPHRPAALELAAERL
ncbi:hypothetical protein ACFQY5_26460 [Paeniroseomonas aquatica]|uniref:hypothetical protein n=1 Tax=Paeniroseomonas aquatica TaxID=373043 RepID=UPI00361E9279